MPTTGILFFWACVYIKMKMGMIINMNMDMDMQWEVLLQLLVQPTMAFSSSFYLVLIR